MYAHESFTDEERSILNRFFTNADLPVFAVVNLPEIVKGAMFARYSRTHKSLRRMFIDDFYEQPDLGIEAIADRSEQTEGIGRDAARKRAEELYQRVLVQYGDDSIAQLGGAHLACEQVSAILAKIIERGRLAAYLEQSTRYIEFDRKLRGGEGYERYRYQMPPEVASGPLAERYEKTMDRLFQHYSYVVQALTQHYRVRLHRVSSRKKPAENRAMVRGLACDAARGLLPASTTSNLGVFATGQAYEAMLIRMRASNLRESRDYALMMLKELRKVIGGFLTRVDVPDRGGAWSGYLQDTASRMTDLVDDLELSSEVASDFDIDRDEVRLLNHDPDAEIRIAVAALYPYSNATEEQLIQRVKALSDQERRDVISAYVGERRNRRHKPGRGMERVYYRFDVLSDFGSFRDLQRHRMMTIDWQKLTPLHGYATPPEIDDIGGAVSDRWHEGMEEMRDFYLDVRDELGDEVAQYVVPFGYRIRYNIQLNARQAFHMLELRTGRAGHSDYRRICLKMYDLIRNQAGHRAITDAMDYIDKDTRGIGGMGRFQAERRQIDGQQLGLELG